MLNSVWWQRKLDLVAEVFYHGVFPPAVHELRGLESCGVYPLRIECRADERWAARLIHDRWGSARLSCPRADRALPAPLIDMATELTQRERELLRRDARVSLRLDLPAREADLLQERKRMLRFVAAIMAEDGLAGLDHASHALWTRDRMADELQHDAALDISQMHVLHATGEGRCTWLHTHGLAELGLRDFDVIEPAPALLGPRRDLLRALALQVVEKPRRTMISAIAGTAPIQLVPAEQFTRRAASRWTQWRDPRGHEAARVICCEADPRSSWARWRHPLAPLPARATSDESTLRLSSPLYSLAASELSARRALSTQHLLTDYHREFADLELRTVVQLRFRIDDRRSNRDHEHLWFEVHTLGSGAIEATLIHEPETISGMHKGDRAHYDIERLTDWTMHSPVGSLNPRNLQVARALRKLRPGH